MDTYFIGYDAREHEAAAVAAFSILRNAKRRSQVYMLEHGALRRLGMFDRPWRVDEDGQFWDDRDGRPFSTAFSHSRFLVFHLARELACTGTCVFLDCDWLFLADPGEMVAQHKASGKAVSCVHRYQEITTTTKMDGMQQHDYARKLWSALFCFTPSDELADKFDPYTVSNATGRDLHGFLGMTDDEIGQIAPCWHVVPSLDEIDTMDPELVKGIHYSEFSPWLNPDRWNEAPELFSEWVHARLNLLQLASKTGKLVHGNDLEKDLKLVYDRVDNPG
jgi:hypothetical protein